MDVKDSIRAGLKELILPEINKIREENIEVKTLLSLTNKRLDDINGHLSDQSRRIDETNKRIDALREELETKILETNKRIDAVREEVIKEIRETNKRLDRLYEVIVRRDEHAGMETRVAALEKDMAEIKQHIVA